MYLILCGVKARYFNGDLGSIPSQDYMILSNLFYYKCFVKEIVGLRFYKQFLFYNKHNYSSNLVMIFHRWKKFVQVTIRGYKFYIILDSDFVVLTVIF